MKKINILISIILFFTTSLHANIDNEFREWKKNFKIRALKNNISEETFEKTMSNVKFLPNVIKYDRYQPEFYEDTKTYISKRTSSKKVNEGLNIYSKKMN